MRSTNEGDPLLTEQIAYYRAIAPEYEDHVIPGPGEDELIAALEAFRPAGDVLELACGPRSVDRASARPRDDPHRRRRLAGDARPCGSARRARPCALHPG